MQSEPAPKVYILSLHDRYREDGRCMAAWETLPRDIPAPHVFDTYYKLMLAECEVQHPAWQTAAQMRDLRAAGTPCFYLGEHLWYWPEDPTKIILPDMHFYAGHPRKTFSAGNIFRLTCDVLPTIPSYLWRIGKFRWHEFITHLSGEEG